jgi:hypothetical protein
VNVPPVCDAAGVEEPPLDPPLDPPPLDPPHPAATATDAMAIIAMKPRLNPSSIAPPRNLTPRAL